MDRDSIFCCQQDVLPGRVGKRWSVLANNQKLIAILVNALVEFIIPQRHAYFRADKVLALNIRGVGTGVQAAAAEKIGVVVFAEICPESAMKASVQNVELSAISFEIVIYGVSYGRLRYQVRTVIVVAIQGQGEVIQDTTRLIQVDIRLVAEEIRSNETERN